MKLTKKSIFVTDFIKEIHAKQLKHNKKYTFNHVLEFPTPTKTNTINVVL